MNISWLKLDMNILNDEKIKIIRSRPAGDSLFVMWIGLLCLGMKSTVSGEIFIAEGFPYDDKTLAGILDLTPEIVNDGIKIFQKLQMVSISEAGIIEIVNFEKWQKLSDIDKYKKINAERQKRFKEKHKQLEQEVKSNVTGNVISNVTETFSNGTDIDKIRLDLDKDLELEKENINTDDYKNQSIPKDELNSKTKSPRAEKFTPPTIEEIEAYLVERRPIWREKWGVPYPSNITAEGFADFYDSRGWIAGKVKMRSWRAAVRTWERYAVERMPELKKRLEENEYDARISDKLTESQLFELLNTCKNSKAGVKRINELITVKRRARGIGGDYELSGH